MACNDPECSDDAAIREAIGRIAYEAHHLREDMAALKALGQARDSVNCPFMLVASSGLQSDLLARLARVLERDGRVGSFWFLHRRGVIQADRRAIKFLSDIADRLQPIRNKVFAHIDKEVLRDPQKPYRDADLHWLSEIEPAIAKISELITRVYETRTGRPFPSANISIAGFQEIFDRDLNASPSSNCFPARSFSYRCSDRTSTCSLWSLPAHGPQVLSALGCSLDLNSVTS